MPSTPFPGDLSDRDARVMFERLLESAPDGMVIVDSSGTIRLVNEKTERLFGYAREDLVGKRIEVLVPEHARQSHVEHRDQYMDHPKSRPMGADLDLKGRRQDGSTFPVEISLSPAQVGEDRLVIAAVRDITRRREAERKEAKAREQERALEKLQERDAFKTQFINNAAHELNTPLTTLLMQVRILQRLEQEGKSKSDSLEVLERNANRFARLVQDLLDASRYQGGRLSLTREEMDLSEVVREVGEEYAPALEEAGLRFAVEVSDGVVVEGDRDRLHQVLDNLLTNAQKFTPEGGTVKVRLEGEDKEAVVRVTDTGCGFEPDDAEVLFQPFARLQTGADAPPGTGLGLYLCRAIATLHRGRLEASSPGPDQGATFTMRLPRM